MILSKYEKKITDHVEEIKQKINTNKEYKEIFEDSLERLQKNPPTSRVEVEDIDVNKIVIDNRVQRNFDLKHAVNTIIAKFDQAFRSLPILVCNEEGKYSIVDGQHITTSDLLVNPKETVKALVIYTKDKFASTKIFKVHNRTGKLRASDYSIWKNDVIDYEMALEDQQDSFCQEILSDQGYMNAYYVKQAAEATGIEIVDSPRKDTGFHFSHIQGIIDCADKVGQKMLTKILQSYVNVWCQNPLAPKKIDNGMIFGMCELYLMASNQRVRYLDEYPDDWMQQVFQSLKDKMGDAKEIHNGLQKQAKERTGGWQVWKQMPTALRDLWQYCGTPEQKRQIDLPFNPDISQSLRIWPPSRAKLVEAVRVNEEVSK